MPPPPFYKLYKKTRKMVRGGFPKGRHPVPFFLFFYKAYKRGGGSFPFIKIYVVDFIYSGGLWQHEIGIEKVF